jgi:hypothetical protein
LYVGASNVQKVSRDIAKPFDHRLSPDERREVRLKLDAAGVRLLACRIEREPSSAGGWRALFDCSRRMGVEVLIGELSQTALSVVESLCDEYDVGFGVSAWKRGRSRRDHPCELLQFCGETSKRIGVCGSIAAWRHHGLEPVEAVGLLRERLSVLQIDSRGEGVDAALTQLKRLDIRPTAFTVGHLQDKSASEHLTRESIESFNKASIQLAR